MTTHESFEDKARRVIFSPDLDEKLVAYAQEAGLDVDRVRVRAVQVLSLLRSNTPPDREDSVIALVPHGNALHVEMHDEFGFSGHNPSMEDIMAAAIDYVSQDIDGLGDDFATDDLVRFYEYLKETTAKFHYDLITEAHKGAGTLDARGHFRLPKIEDIDPIDREAMFALYNGPSGPMFPKSALLKAMQRERDKAK